VHPRFQTPFFCTWLVGIVFGLMAAFVPLNVLNELVNIGTLAAFSLVSIAIVILRKTRPDLKRAFRCPGVPVVPALAVIFCVTLMAYLSWFTWVAFGIWLAHRPGDLLHLRPQALAAEQVSDSSTLPAAGTSSGTTRAAVPPAAGIAGGTNYCPHIPP
jgi:hypothetical protein